MQNYEKNFIANAGNFYILSIFLIERTTINIKLNIGIARRTTLDSVKYIREYIIERSAKEDISMETLLEINNIVERNYSKKYIPSYYIVTNFKLRNIDEKLRNKIICKSNLVLFTYTQNKTYLNDIDNYLINMLELTNIKKQTYAINKKEKYKGIII